MLHQAQESSDSNLKIIRGKSTNRINFESLSDERCINLANMGQNGLDFESICRLVEFLQRRSFKIDSVQQWQRLQQADFLKRREIIVASLDYKSIPTVLPIKARFLDFPVCQFGYWTHRE